jgi:hypothetical protein
MLLFVLSRGFFEPHGHGSVRSSVELRENARALVVAGAVLAGWCALRLCVRSSEGTGFDLALALICLGLGMRAILSGARALRC